MKPDPTRGAAPTDLDLMLYADGELESERVALVEAWLQRDPAARAKLTALDMVSGMVREGCIDGSAGRDQGIANAVMARIDAEPAAPRLPGGIPGPGPVPMREAAKAIPQRSTANDNARGLYLVAAFVVAAAAVVLLWRAPLGGGHGPLARGVVEDEMAATSPSEAKHEGEVEHGVEVSSIDFGSANGAVFYVPTGPSSTTTVVWLADDEDEAAGDEP